MGDTHRPDVLTPAARRWAAALLVAVLALGSAACDGGGADNLAPYEGARALDLLRVTQSFTPEIQWVGGRVAAVGVNRGTRPALDSTLVWMQQATGNTISSFATVGQASAQAAVEGYGGTFQSQLTDGETYTVWIAEQAALDAGLDSNQVAAGALADTTLTMQLVLRGRNGGGAGVTFRIERDQRLTGEQYIVRWTPETVRFRRFAIRKASTGGFTDLLWYVQNPDGGTAAIGPPVTIGVAPDGTDESTPFPDTGFEPAIHTLWATTDAWTGSFSPAATGYSFFQIFANNFETQP